MKIPKSEHYGENIRKHGGSKHMPCVVCGRSVADPKYMVECVNGGLDQCVLPGTVDTEEPGYMGCFPVGPDCLKRHPQLRPFVVEGSKHGA